MSGAAYSVAVKTRHGRFHLDAAFEGSEGVTVLFGPSGAGKSSILAAVAGALRPDEGRIVLGERTLLDRSRGIDEPPERRAIGWVFQDARLFPHLGVEGNLRYGLERVRGRPSPIAFDAVVEALGVGPLLNRRPLSLSGGEAQRVALGRALLSQPRLLLMDEPLAALDEDRKAEILTFIERVRDLFGTPMLYVTHSRSEARRLADRVVRLEAGAVVATGGAALLAGPAAGGL
jgi:molybdate transport system ATP-binding protein